MKLVLALSSLFLVGSIANAESVYTCTEDRGDSIIIEMSRQGENMHLRTLDRQLNLTQSKRRPKKSDYYRYHSSRGSVSLQESVVRGDGGSGVVGNLRIEGHVYPCKVGRGKLVVSRATRREMAGGGGSLFSNCRVRYNYGGTLYSPPVSVCNGGRVIMRMGTGLPF